MKILAFSDLHTPCIETISNIDFKISITIYVSHLEI